MEGIEMSAEQAVKIVGETAVQQTIGYVTARCILATAEKRGWRRTTRLYTWSTKPKVVAVSYILGLAMELLNKETELRQAKQGQLAARIAGLEAQKRATCLHCINVCGGDPECTDPNCW